MWSKLRMQHVLHCVYLHTVIRKFKLPSKMLSKDLKYDHCFFHVIIQKIAFAFRVQIYVHVRTKGKPQKNFR